jgi:aprataxin
MSAMNEPDGVVAESATNTLHDYSPQMHNNACPSQSTQTPTNPSNNNTVTELMKPKLHTQTKHSRKGSGKDPRHSNNPLSQTLAPMEYTGQGRDGLLEYIKEPDDMPGTIYYTNDWVLIKDMYPKSRVHFLLLPRNPDFYRLHPFRSLSNPSFLSDAKQEINKAISIAASELCRLFGHHSATERPRIEAMESDNPLDELPQGRDWKRELMAGVHAYPSMNHMHIHIISVDRHSPYLKHAKHYNTFNTKFFVPIDDFPLSEEDDRRDTEKLREYTSGDLICWRCGRNFGRSFVKLKEHLEQEFVAWRQE